MQLGLEGTGVVVAGGSRGIGAAIVRSFLDEGARVVVAARSQPDLDRLAEALGVGDRLVAVACDVGDPDECVRLVDEARAALGAVDVLCANATANAAGSSHADYRSSFDVDLMQAVRLTDALRAAQPGHPLAIVATASINGKAGDSVFHGYGALKAALLAWVKYAAVAYGPDGTRVNAVAPGATYFEDGWWDHVLRDDPAEYARTVAAIPLGRMGSAEEVADVVVFLASRRASHVTGATVLVDGGEYKGVA
jgi:3-oxoacyl-[acyl-carrier protein] reductase